MRVAGLRLAAALLVAAGCGGGSDTTEAHIQLVVADRNIRREGVECAGARPFQHVRAGAPFEVEAADGAVVFDGELPAGRARNAEPDIDWGWNAFRPSACSTSTRGSAARVLSAPCGRQPAARVQGRSPHR